MHAQAEVSLSGLQARIAGALLAAEPAAQQLPEEFFCGAHPGAVGLRVHRNTVLAAACHALRLSHLAVDRLVGESFFDRMAVDFARVAPPRAPQLDDYGAGFAAWIDGYPGTEQLPYLSEVARFDWQLAGLARRCVAADGGPLLQLEGGARLQFAAPLRTHCSPYPVDELRTAILGDNLAALAGLDLAPGAHHYALWRVADGLKVRALGAASARFLEAVLAGADGPSALAAAAAGGTGGTEADAPQLAETLAREILPASFLRVSAAS
jgi:hypothetical protein